MNPLHWDPSSDISSRTQYIFIHGGHIVAFFSQHFFLPEWKCTDTRCFHVSTEELSFYDTVSYCDSLNPITLNQTIVSGNRNASVLFVGSDAAITEVEDLFDFLSSTRLVWVNCISKDSDTDFVCTADDKGTLTNITRRSSRLILDGNWVFHLTNKRLSFFY